ncbi:C-type lectin domain family 4 member M isoform X1 [Salmo salar]|uniref:C-type lectin domain family 4 member M isoform X1 n=1 Tax=Salmo salar TaxID=8030 RepID=A0ABM3E998_SALSA|nr:C-type lectin domain family 4 member M-like isoform X1 [Salmo salar]
MGSRCCRDVKHLDKKGPVEEVLGEHLDKKGPAEEVLGEHLDKKGPAEEVLGEHLDKKGPAEEVLGEHLDKKGPAEEVLGEYLDKKGPAEEVLGEHLDKKCPAEEVLSENIDKDKEAEMNCEEEKPLKQVRDESKPEEGFSGRNRETSQVLPAPDQLTVDSVDTTSAAVSWSQPPGLDQTQHHYQISYHCPGTERHITTTSSHSITLSDLQRGTQYSVTVCTVLENGKQSQLVSTTLNTVHFQWWKRPSRVAAVCVLLAVILGLLESYAEIDQLQNSLNTRTTERDQLKTRLRFYEKPCLDGWWKFGTSCYYVSSTMETGRGGQKECRAMGADDVIINSREEQIFINGFKKNVWIGALKLDGIWKWVDNTPFNTTYWMEGEPNNLNDKCVEISQTASDPLKSWKAVPCTSNYWVCEKPSTP